MTKREAIRACKKMWKEIVKSGLSKKDFMLTEAGQKWTGKGYVSDCPLCEYTWRKLKRWDCPRCPLYLQYKPKSSHGGDWGYCFTLGFNDDPKAFYEYVKGLKE